ncbi:hypothetical protein EEL33_07240 [Muribaculaceae bacterium Isolate-037 (Harlan)]|nr:hypothetical protein EEL33_07240 [Muribaculaceae bacterium Isolate-037 (Harlan)]
MDWIRGKVLQVWRGICKFVNYLYSMCIGNYISRVKADPRSGKVALGWILFMIFFTYTDLVVALCSAGDTFKPAFQGMHIRMVSLLVNFGFVVMLLFDYSSKVQQLNRNYVWMSMFALFLALAMFLHCNVVENNEHSGYVFPLCWDAFSILLFVVFLGIVFVLKTFVEFSEVTEVTEVTEGKG